MSPREKLARMGNAFARNCSRLYPGGTGGAGVLLLAAILGLAAPTSGYAATLTVCASGCGYTTIAAAIAAASSGDTISIQDTVHTESGIIVNKNLIIEGQGSANTAVDGNAESSVFVFNQGVTAGLQNLTIQNGSTAAWQYGEGGGIVNWGVLTLSDCAVSGNAANRGAGIDNIGTLTISDSTIANNTGIGFSPNGGGVFNIGTLTISDSTVSGNSSVVGGGIYNAGAITISFTTIAGNSANSSPALGGGLFNFPSGTSAILKNSIIGDNVGGDCKGLGVSALAANLDTDGTCGTTNFTQVTSEQLALDPLALNPPGTTATIAIGPTSAAKDAVTDCTDAANNPVATDQRGVTRPQGSACDIGAFELQANPTSAIGTTIEFGPTTGETDSATGENVTMGAFVHDKAMVDTTVSNIPADSSVTFNTYGNNTCSGDPTSSDTVAIASGSMSAEVESSGSAGVAARGPLSVGALSYNAAFTSGDIGVVPNATSPCEPLNIGSSITKFSYLLDGDTEPAYSCTLESIVDNTCTNGAEAEVAAGSLHSFQVNVEVKNLTGLPITEKAQGGLSAGKNAAYSGLSVSPGCGGATLKSNKNTNVVIWNYNGSSATNAAGFTMAPGAVCTLQVTVTKRMGKVGQDTITGSWEESQTETSPLTGRTVTMTSPGTGSLAVKVVP